MSTETEQKLPLESKNMYSQGVLVKVHHPVLGSARCSGLLVDNVLVAHGNLLAPLCLDDDPKNILKKFDQLIGDCMKMQYFVNPEHYDTGDIPLDFTVLKKNLSITKKDEVKVDHRSISEGKDSNNDIYTQEEAKLCLVYKYKEVVNIIDEISNWTNSGSSSESERQDRQFGHLVIPVFLFLMVGIPTKNSFEKTLNTVFNTVKAVSIHPGLPIIIESTPFGNYPFFNSLSRGIISKIMGFNQDIMLTDARLTSGCEAAPIYAFENGVKGVLIGVVIWTLSLISGEWIGFSLGLSIKHLLKAVLGLKTEDYIPFNKLKPLRTPSINVERLSASVIYVRCQHKWGSGVVVDAELGLVLTCSHIIDHAHDSVHVVYKGLKFPATVIYASPISKPYDLALLSVGRIPGLKPLPLAENSPIIGEPVITAGYPMSTESSVMGNDTPLLSGGCISKVCRRGGPLQTTCCTHSGMSGGAVIRPPDQVIGIVVYNVRLGSTVLPFFSFAITVDDFRTAVTQYIKSRGNRFA